jgi:putative CocE/NonD family hydrolase
MTIDAGVTSSVFLAGHRIRLEVSSSNFPRFDRNPNTGRPVADETVLNRAQQTIYHGPQYPAHVLLPVIPQTASPAGDSLSPAAKANPSKALSFRAR